MASIDNRKSPYASGQKPARSCDEKIGGVVARNSLEVVARKSVELWQETRLKLWLENRRGSWRENRLELRKKFDKIRPVGWITLTRFLFNRNIFPLER